MDRRFYKEGGLVVEVITSSDGMQEKHEPCPLEEVQILVDSGDAVLHESHIELVDSCRYASTRRAKYPDVGDQLDQIFHEGIDAWKETIQAVKDAHPKPEKG